MVEYRLAYVVSKVYSNRSSIQPNGNLFYFDGSWTCTRQIIVQELLIIRISRGTVAQLSTFIYLTKLNLTIEIDFIWDKKYQLKPITDLCIIKQDG